MVKRLVRSARAASFGKRALVSAIAVVMLALGLVTLAPAQRAEAGPAPVMTGYVPMPADDYQALFESINTAADTTLDYTVGITNAGNGAIMYYDHWEDGYEADIANPVQSTTEVWGDGNAANGDAGAANRCGARCTGDLLTPGDVFVLRNNITVPRNSAQIRFDGRDKIASTRGFSTTVGTWTTPLGSVLAGAVAAYDTTKYGTSFVLPVGQDTAFAGNDPFEFVGASIMAANDNTVVQVDNNADGTFDTTQTINQGQTVLVNGGLSQGARIVASKPVQAHVVTGDVGDTYESRSYILLPLSLLSNDYMNPVGSNRTGYATIVYLYNPNPTAITVDACTANPCPTPTSIAMPANSGAFFTMSLGLGARFVSQGGERFEAFAATGARASNNNASATYSANWDWGNTLIPTSQLTTQAVLAWAPGDSGNPPGNDDYNPVWVTALNATTIRVDYDGDPSTGAIASSDCFGARHDVDIPITALASQNITDPNDSDMTGARIYTCDGNKIAAAWGENPSVASTGSPGLDAGYTIIPSTTMVLNKTGGLFTDTNGDGKFGPGDQIEYTIAIADAGSLAFTSVNAQDTLPPGVSYVPGSTTFDNGVVTPIADNAVPPATSAFPLDESGASLPNINAGQTVFVRFKATIDNPRQAAGTIIANTVCVNAAEANACDTEETPLAAADLSLTKALLTPPTLVGTNGTFRITVSNAGPDTATGIEVTDVLPAGLAFQSATASQGSYASGTGIWSVGTLASGASATLDLTAQVNVASATNFAQVTKAQAADPDSQPAENPLGVGNPPDQDDEASATVTATPLPNLNVTKSDGGATTTPGSTVAYTLSYGNAGPGNATGVTLTETVPANTTFNAGASSGGWSCANGSPAGTTCTLSLGNLASGGAGSRTFAVTVANPLPAGVAQVANSATIGATEPDGDPTDNTGTDTTPVTAAPDLTVTKSDGGASTTPGGTVVYTLSYANVGNQGATGVVLSETVPANATFNAGASSGGWSCTPNGNAGSTCTLAVGSLAAGANGSRTFAVTVVNPVGAGVTQLSNTATIADDGTNGTDPTPGNNTSTDTTPITAAPDLTVTKSDGGASTTPGGTVAYTLTYANVGNQGATGVTLSETVPANATFAAGTSTPGWSCADGAVAGTTCTFTVGSVAAGAGGSATFAVTVVNPVGAGVTQLSNTATIADDGTNGTDPTPGNNTSTDTTPITAAPDLTVTKSDGGATTTPGGTVAYTLSYGNVGNKDATGVVLSETVPANATFNAGASTGGWSCTPNANAGSTCTLAVGSLAAGANGTATFAVTVVSPVGAGVTQLSNTATIADDGTNGTDPTPGNNTSTDTTPITAAPDLAVTKSDGGASTTPGGTVVYTLTYANNGNKGATGVVLSETVPANATFAAGTSTPGWSCADGAAAGTTCTFTVGSVAAGSGGSVTFAVTTNTPLPAGVTQLSNTVTIADDGTNGTDPTPGDNSSTDTTPVTAAPDLTIAKSDGGATTTPGGTVAYTLTYANAGSIGATGVVLSETVPANATFNAGLSTPGWSCADGATAGTTCTFTVGSVAAGAGGSATFAVTVVNPVGAGVTQLSNTATVTDDGTNGTDPTPGNNTSTDTTPITAAPDLSVTKSDGGATATPGGTVTYTLGFANNGNQGATGVTLSETVPANATFNAGASSGGWSCANGSPAGTACTITIGNLAAGASGSRTFAVTVANPLPAGVTQIANTVTVADDGTNGPDPTPGNNTGSDTTPVTAAPDLTIVKSDGGATTSPGGTVVYTLTYANVGNQNATGVVLSDTVPANSGFDPGPSSPGWLCAPNNAAGSTCTLAIGSLPAGSGGSVTFAVTTADPLPAGVTQLTNTATIADDGTNGSDPTPANNTSTDTTPANSQADLSLTKVVDNQTPNVGELVTFTVTVSNAGPNQATKVSVADLLPAGLAFVSSAPSQGTYNSGTGVWAVGTLANGGSATITISATVQQPGTIQNFAQVVASDMGDPDSQPAENPLGVGNPPDQDDEGVATIGAVDLADVSVTKTDGVSEVTPGDVTTYSITYSNAGPSDAAGVALTETVPTGSTFVASSSTAGWTCTPDANAGSTCTFDVGSLPSGASGTVVFAVRITSPAAVGQTTVVNTVTVSSITSDPNPGNNSASDTDSITPQSDLSLTKTVDNATPKVGDPITFTVTVSNAGPNEASGVTVDDLLPAGLSFSSASPSQGTYDANTGVWTVGSIANGASATLGITAVPLQPGTIQNFAEVSGSELGDPDSQPKENPLNADSPPDQDDEGAASITAADIADVSVTKTDGVTLASPGDLVTYTLGYANSGPSDAANVVLTETVPAGSTFVAASSTAGWVCTPDANAGSTCTLAVGTVANGAGGSATFAVRVAYPLPGGQTALDNTVTVATTTDESTTTNNSASDSDAIATGTLGDTVFVDVNGNSAPDPGEGLVGITVRVIWPGPDGTFGNGDDVSTPATTAADGVWTVTGLPAGPLRVVVDTSTLPGGIVNTVDPDGGNDSASAVVLPAGGTDLKQDFGYRGNAVIGDRVWDDTNANGVQDPGEPGHAGVTVELLDGGGSVVASTSTDASGLYQFANLVPGDYEIRVTAPAGTVFGKPNAGADDNVDSDVAVATGRTGTFFLSGGVQKLDVDAALVTPAKVSGSVFADADDDGAVDPGEPGIAGATVTLTGTDDLGNPVVVTTTTAADGSYTFAGLRPGTYTVTETQPAGFLDGKDAAGTAGGTVGADTVTGIVLASGTDATGYSFGELPSASLAGTVVNDLNGNGTVDGGEPGIANATVTLTGTDDLGNPVVVATTTAADGSYTFAGLRPGTYSVTETQPAGFLDGADLVGSLGGSAANDLVSGIFVLPGATGTGYRFLEVAPSSIGDRVWRDIDGDAVQDPGETGLPNVTVRLFADLDTNGSFEAPVATTTTAADGSYTFADLAIGSYQVQVDATTVPAGYTASTPTSFDRPITTGGTTVTDADAGFQPPPGSIGDTVFLDLDGDGTQDPGEPGVPGVTVTLQDSGGSTIATTTTDGSGTYAFTGLTAADYKVVVTPPAGFTTSSPASLDRTLAEGASVTDADFAILGATIGDRVWDDTNGNGVQDSGEPGRAGVTVELLDGGGNVVASTTTDATGLYAFSGRAAGDYELRVTAPAGSLFATPDAGADDAADSDVAVLTGRTGVFAVAAGATDTSRDAGLVPPASLAGRVFGDIDDDGVVDPGDNGIAGATVTLTGTDDLGNPVTVTTTTAADGTYSFANLRPGTYTVTETQPAGFLDGKDTAGTGGGTVGADTVSGVVLGAGQSVDGYLFAELSPSSMTGRVWNDLDDDGVADPGEPGIAGVTVTLTGTDDLGPVTRTATTAADGGYAFTNLRPGTYTITETQPSTFLDGQDAVGTLGGTLGNDSISGIVVPTGTAGASYLFGEVAPVSIGDRVWSDTNGDGVQDPGENGLPGITVTLRQDVDGDGTYETAVGTDVTDANGLYLFEQLRPGRYRVAVDATTVPAEVTATTPANQDRVTTGGQSVTDADFGFLPAPPPSGSIGDRVWSDTDGDGVQDAAEPGLGGVLVTLLRDADSNGSYETTVGSAITTGAGDYHFTGLEAGAYRVVVTAPSGQTPTTSETIDIALAHRQVVDTADFGYRPPAPPPPASIGDRVWDDVDGDGVQDPGEAGLSGVTVTLRQDTDGNGSFETEAATQVTGANGAYEFANLPVGSYRVVVTVPSGRSATTPTAVSANLTGGQVVDTADFGLRTTAPATGSIGDRVWDDTDGDGVQDLGEAGSAGVTVTLRQDVDGDGTYETVVGTDVTDASGTYGFADLAPGSYRVVVTPPNGFSPTTPTIVPVELTAGEVVADADFGIRQAAPATGTIGDRVWSDTDRDGVQDAGEPGLNGVTVVLLKDTDGDGTYETTVSTQNTAGDGEYHFTDVPAGAYLVRVTPPAGQSPTTPSSIPVALAAGQIVDDADVGMATPPSIPFDLALTKSLEAPMVAGGEATWVLDIRNNGIAASPNPVTVTDVLPTGITYKGFTGTGWSCSASGQTVTCTLPQSIGVGGTTQLKIVTTVATTPGVEVTNNAAVSAEGVEVTLANNADDAVGSIQPIPTTTTTAPPTTTSTSTSTSLPPVSITISPTTTVVTTTTSGSLPKTGSDTWRLALVAMGLVGAGSLLLLWRRRLQG